MFKPNTYQREEVIATVFEDLKDADSWSDLNAYDDLGFGPKADHKDLYEND